MLTARPAYRACSRASAGSGGASSRIEQCYRRRRTAEEPGQDDAGEEGAGVEAQPRHTPAVAP